MKSATTAMRDRTEAELHREQRQLERDIRLTGAGRRWGKTELMRRLREVSEELCRRGCC